MKNVVITIALVFLSARSALAGERESKPTLSLYLTTDAAYYPASECKSGGSHFAPITGAYGGIECCTTLSAECKIATPLGEHWLLRDANVVLGAAVELSPVSVRPHISVGFQPLPFLIFKTGATLGFGWNVLGFEGLCAFDTAAGTYKPLSTFVHPFYAVWAEATVQFDTGAVIPGDWTHVIFLGSFRTFYAGLAGIENHTPYEWQGDKNRVNGLQYELTGIVAYQMPLALRRAGIRYASWGHYDASDYGDIAGRYDGVFMGISIAPLLQFAFGAHDELICLFDFSSRRSFDQAHDTAEEELHLKATGREWFFNRVALSWTHRF